MVKSKQLSSQEKEAMDIKARQERERLDGLEERIFGADREKFREALNLIVGMSDTGRRFFLARISNWFMGNAANQPLTLAERTAMADALNKKE